MTRFILECNWCGGTFERAGWKVRGKKAKKVFCGDECRVNGKKRAQLDFWSLVDILSPEECWLWKGGLDTNGYGFFEQDGKHIIAHRRAYELANGPIPEGEGYYGTVIMHSCDSPPCCNPKHLVPGTQTQNMKDMVSRRRMKHKLTDEQVRKIRADPRETKDICGDYGVSQSTICDILSYRTWAHLE